MSLQTFILCSFSNISSIRFRLRLCFSTNFGSKSFTPFSFTFGPKAGGHLGFKLSQIWDDNFSLEKLLPEVLEVAAIYKEEKNIPVIAADGVASGEDIYHLMQMGASGVQMGSVFVTSIECDASIEFKTLTSMPTNRISASYKTL